MDQRQHTCEVVLVKETVYHQCNQVSSVIMVLENWNRPVASNLLMGTSPSPDIGVRIPPARRARDGSTALAASGALSLASRGITRDNADSETMTEITSKEEFRYKEKC